MKSYKIYISENKTLDDHMNSIEKMFNRTHYEVFKKGDSYLEVKKLISEYISKMKHFDNSGTQIKVQKEFYFSEFMVQICLDNTRKGSFLKKLLSLFSS